MSDSVYKRVDPRKGIDLLDEGNPEAQDAIGQLWTLFEQQFEQTIQSLNETLATLQAWTGNVQVLGTAAGHAATDFASAGAVSTLQTQMNGMSNIYATITALQAIQTSLASVQASIPSASNFASASDGALARSALQSIPLADINVVGGIKKAAALTNAPATGITDNTGGIISVTLVLPLITGAIWATDSPGIKGAISTLISMHNKSNARFEELIAKLKASGALATP